MKKASGVLLSLLIIALTCSFTFKFPNLYISSKGSSSIKKGIESISPGTAQQNAQLTAQIQNIKKTIDNNNSITKLISQKKLTTMKLIRQIKGNKKTLTSDQTTSVNNLLTAIDTESKKIKALKGLDIIYMMDKFFSKNRTFTDKILSKYSTQDLTNIQNTLNENAAHLTNISLDYDTIINVLTKAASTTPSAISLPVTTQSAIGK